MRAPWGAVLLAVTTGAASAAAQEEVRETTSIALNQFDPTPAGDVFNVIPSPYAIGEIFEPRAKIVMEGASDPLRLLQGQDQEVGAVVSSQLFMHLDASAGIVDRALISVLVPVALKQSGDSPSAEGLQAASPDSAQLGDLRIGLRLRLFGEPKEPFQIGTGGYLWVPTGPSGSYVGEDAIRITPYLSLGGPFELGPKWWWTVSAGADIRAGANASRIRYGAGIAAVFFEELMQLSTEVYAATPIQDSSNFQLTGERDVVQTQNSNVEMLFGARVRVWHFTAGAAGGPGLTKAIGTPAFRLVATVSYDPLADEPDPARADADGDDIVDPKDACPHSFGPRDRSPKRNGCPVLDDDEDGVPNHEDACPDTYGAESEKGCAPQT